MSRKQPNPPPPAGAVRPAPPPAPPPLAVAKLARYLQHEPACAKVHARTRFPYNEATAFCTCGLDEAAHAVGLR